MSDKILLDTNLWVYLYTPSTPHKYEPIKQILVDHFQTIILSTQILGELYNVLTRKQLRTPTQARTIILEMSTTFPVLEIDTPKVWQALDINAKYQYSYWDSLIIATALLGDCQTLYSEDLHHTQQIEDRVQIINPYL